MALAARQEAVLARIGKVEKLLGLRNARDDIQTLPPAARDVALRQVQVLAAIAAVEHRLGICGPSTSEPRPYKVPATDEPPAEVEVPCAPSTIYENQDPALVERLTKDLRAHGVHQARLTWVPSYYYEKPLEWRRDVLNAFSVHHLCKTIVVENTRASPEVKGCEDRNNSRYYAVVVQYVARFNAEKMAKLVFNDLNKRKISQKHFNFRLAPEEASDELTGYVKNGVTPVAMAHPVPIVVSHRIGKLLPSFFFLGGGHIDLKLGVDFDQFVKAYDANVADVTYDDGVADLDS